VSPESNSLMNEREHWWPTVLAIGITLLAPLPVLIIPYLAMTDLPQHFATLSILVNLHNPAYGFDKFYELDFSKSLYIVPYLIGWALSYLMSIEMALRVVVYLSLITYPLGVLAMLRAQGKPALLALLAIPLVFNFSTFWGFINLNLAVGVAFFAFALFSREQPTLRSEIALFILCLINTATHLYGAAFILGYAGLWWIFGTGPKTVRRFLPLLPCLVGAALWMSMWQKGIGVHTTQWTPLSDKILKLQNSVLGGYKDWSETWVLCGFSALAALFAIYGFWRHRQDLGNFLNADRVVTIYIVLNGFAFLALPLHLPTAKFVYMRHIIIAFCMIPLVVPPDFVRKLAIIAVPLLTSLAILSIGNAWYHLFRFDFEAYNFNHIVDRTPREARMIQITLDPYGGVMKTAPYLHFLAYIQGKKGGVIATSFALYAWLAPIKKLDRVHVPIVPETFEWRPDFYDYKKFGYYYNYVLIRGYHPITEKIIHYLPFQLVQEVPPWRLFKAIEKQAYER
jgi:hypothetical protein